MLNRLKLRTKLALLIGCFAIGLIASNGIGASMMHQRMIEDRVDKLRAVVLSTVAIAQSLQNRVVAHELTHEEAYARFAADVHAIRIDGGDGYLTVQNLDGVVVLHATTPAMEGKKSPTKHFQHVATGTNEITRTIADVGEGANEAGKSAGGVLEAAGRLSRQAGHLSGEVSEFLAGVRAA